MSKYIKVAHRANALKEDASQVPHRAIVHYCDSEAILSTTLCGKVETRDTDIADQKRVVSCPECLKAHRELFSGDRIALADSELVTILYQRSKIAETAGHFALANTLDRAAALLYHEAKREIPHDTSVPEAGDDDLTPPKHESFNCALCHDSGRRFGKICECIAGKNLALNSGRCNFKFTVESPSWQPEIKLTNPCNCISREYCTGECAPYIGRKDDPEVTQ